MTADACADCGSTTWVASVVHDGRRECAACYIGLTPLLRAGVLIAATPGEMGKEPGTVSPARQGNRP